MLCMPPFVTSSECLCDRQEGGLLASHSAGVVQPVPALPAAPQGRTLHELRTGGSPVIPSVAT